mmetsp:Transcript_47667/g.91002  ORF Transcript_47667/g.91002 Transcript_47667/m.91002 type:complete len:186 (-) Transcript_47667:254-811(-)
MVDDAMETEISPPPDDSIGRKAMEARTGCSERERFLLELEFVQCLANPHYINHLAQTRLLEDPAFVNYLKYLEYWRQPQYAKFIIYPHCLHFLELLQCPNFRKVCSDQRATDFMHSQQLYFWLHYRNTRLQALQEQSSDGKPSEDGEPPIGLYQVYRDNFDPSKGKDETSAQNGTSQNRNESERA